MCSSAFPGLSDGQVRGATKPFLDLVAHNVGFPIELKLEKVNTAEQLLTFGQKLSDPRSQTHHMGAMWGLEYGWIEQKVPGLKPLILAASGTTNFRFRFYLMVREEEASLGLKGFQGKKRARIENTPALEEALLARMLQKQGLNPKGFFDERAEPFDEPRSAIDAIRKRHADCVFLSLQSWDRIRAISEPLTKGITMVADSPDFPEAVLIGSEEKINRLQAGLWKKLQHEILTAQKTAQGKNLIQFWRFESFVKPDTKYLEAVKEAARETPLSLLSR
jgi:ABC-type phosphate/phosphonate transport system substrate-binding protein